MLLCVCVGGGGIPFRVRPSSLSCCYFSASTADYYFAKSADLWSLALVHLQTKNTNNGID